MKLRSVAATALVVALAFVAGRASRAQEADAAAKEKKVRKLLELNGTTAASRAQFDSMCAQFGKDPGIPRGFEAKFRELAKPSDIVDLVVPVYMKNLDDEVLDGLVTFYSGPVWQKFAKAEPAIAEESHDAGVKWGQATALKCLQALQAKGGDKKPAGAPGGE